MLYACSQISAEIVRFGPAFRNTQKMTKYDPLEIVLYDIIPRPCLICLPIIISWRSSIFIRIVFINKDTWTFNRPLTAAIVSVHIVVVAVVLLIAVVRALNTKINIQSFIREKPTGLGRCAKC
jgi:hypothetical protein